VPLDSDDELSEYRELIDGPEFEAQISASGSSSDFDFADFPTSFADRLGSGFGAESRDRGDNEGSRVVGPLASQDNLPGSDDDLAALEIQARRDLALSFKKERKAALKHRITREDFETAAQKFAFDVLDARTRRVLKRNGDPQFWLDLEWMFGSPSAAGDSGGKFVSFDLVCRVLLVRPEVFRLRIMYSFWLDWVVFPQPVPSFARNLPDQTMVEAEGHADMLGSRCVQEAWMRPGTTLTQLVACVRESYGEAMGFITDDEVRSAVAALDEACILSEQAGHWYCTGRNPALRDARRRESLGWGWEVHGSSYAWSRLFPW